MNKSFYVLLFFTLIIGFLTTGILYKSLPLFAADNLVFCQKLASHIMFKIPRSLILGVVLTFTGILVLGFLSFLLQLIRTQIFLGKLFLKRIKNTKYLIKISERLNLNEKVILVKERKLYSFCSGIFRPKIILSTALLRTLSKKELEAVLLHEQSHMLMRDPLKVLLGKTVSSMFFFLPIFKELYKNIEATNELLADQWTMRSQKNSLFLRHALKKILAAPNINLLTASGISGSDYFEIRINRLINPAIKQRLRVSLFSLITTSAFILTALLMLQSPASAFHTASIEENEFCANQCEVDLEESASYIPAHMQEKNCESSH